MTKCKIETADAMAMDGADLSKPVGEQDPICCFAAGTLVHAKQGLIPIEQIKVGDWVLSKHENGGGEQAYKRVTRTIKSEKKVPIVYLEYFSELSYKMCGLFVTNEHPLFVKNVGWSPVIEVVALDELVSFDGAPVRAAERFVLWDTPEENVAIGFGKINDDGVVIDFKNGGREIVCRDGDESYLGGRCSEWCETVYNLEVEDFHTYYVGELGVWVHNMNCDANPAIADVSRKAEIEKAGFDGETPVHVDRPNQYGDCVEEIQYIEAGDRVLSRCEETGEMAYKRVLKKFSHGLQQQYMLDCGTEIESQQELWYVGPLYAAEEHPFWVQGKGWVAVRDLKAGDVLLSCDGAYTELRHISKAGVHEVWNLEVEDFHTYFVTHTGIWVHNEKARVEISSQPMAPGIEPGSCRPHSPPYETVCSIGGD
ncbi:polymorphic toxin-type HINT domain-containing protein [Roseateles sp. BYS96W]